MQALVGILGRSLPKPPSDLLLAANLRPVWQRKAPENLKGVEPLWYCRGRLVVAAPGSAYAARLREEAPGLIQSLRAEVGLDGLREIVVRPAQRVPQARAVATAAPRSAVAARCFGTLAASIDDPALKASLGRLAATLAPADGAATSRP